MRMVEGRRMANIVYCLNNDMLLERSKLEKSSCSKVKCFIVRCISEQVSVFVHDMTIHTKRKNQRFLNGRL